MQEKGWYNRWRNEYTNYFIVNYFVKFSRNFSAENNSFMVVIFIPDDVVIHKRRENLILHDMV